MNPRQQVALALAAIWAALAPAWTTAAEPPEAALLSDAELAEQRGGFSWQGMDIRFGAEIRSYLGDEQVMQTNVTWTDTNLEIQRTVSHQLTPLAPDHSTLSPALKLPAGMEGAFLANQGQTAFIQRTDGTIQNVIVNVASNVDLAQDMAITLDVGNYAPFRDGILATRLAAALTGAASVPSLGLH